MYINVLIFKPKWKVKHHLTTNNIRKKCINISILYCLTRYNIALIQLHLRLHLLSTMLTLHRIGFPGSCDWGAGYKWNFRHVQSNQFSRTTAITRKHFFVRLWQLHHTKACFLCWNSYTLVLKHYTRWLITIQSIWISWDRAIKTKKEFLTWIFITLSFPFRFFFQKFRQRGIGLCVLYVSCFSRIFSGIHNARVF